ncbi:hypothetical protein AMATHDRAFT_65071 [Amanita thiersii Skay4041]|uniref:CSC1/OSCA1-like 7TM region domain-containing protein n=1 Tax=Amanita thiersii Skay4041 TaxID=703135 RepID=A0A2A9NEV4_9AGAR|nr:hypothetical protein AMATHDRAFT_65071 [Amanita thiersii Skay4041]
MTSYFDDNDKNHLPPGTPPMQKFEGPWFTTQLVISTTIGLISFLLFSYCRTRWPLSFAPRTKLKGFSPHEAHSHQAFFGWLMPTIRTSEFTILQIVGLDAAVLLNFFKMSFYLFSVCSLFAVTILMPLNWKHNKDTQDEWPDDGDDWPSDRYFASLSSFSFSPTRIRTLVNSTVPSRPHGNGTWPFPARDWLDLISDADSYLSTHLLFTYLFTILSLYFIHKNYRRFVRSRQLFSLEHVHSIPARTVLVTDLPPHLQGDRPLAEYFEHMGLAVESVNICREVGSLKDLLDRRTKALLELESAWVQYVGNPSTVEEYDPEDLSLAALDVENGNNSLPQPGRFVVPHRKRPTLRPRWFKPKVDALEYLETRFKTADEVVKKRRRLAKFKATHAAFVTFEKMSSAQIAVQAAHGQTPGQLNSFLAPEPRDIVWSNMSLSSTNLRVRDLFVLGVMAMLFLFWIFPITALASLLSYKEIKKAMPWLGELIDSNPQIRAIVQNSLPSVAMITLNAMLPFMLEALTYIQGYKARSWIEYSLLKKYFLFLLVNVVFIFLVASTYWQLVRDLANSPAKVPEKLATALQAGRARHFFLSYVILQGLGIMPLQLLNLGVIIPRMFMRMFTRTPRDFAELNAPPMINYGVVYPQAILMFVITLLYSVVQPLIVIFGAIYFGVGYVVYKYKLLFVFYKPYESQGQAWPLTFIRLIWGINIYLLFMIGIFTLRKSYLLSSLLVPLLFFTVVWSWYVTRTFRPLSKYVSLSAVFEVQRGEDIAEVVRLREGHPVTWSQSHLNRRRYAQNDDTLYVAPEDERTDYSQPPMANWYSGILNTGKKRYGHPALTGVLPEPWLPLKKGQTLVNSAARNGARVNKDGGQAVVLTLRNRFSGLRRGARHFLKNGGNVMMRHSSSIPVEDSATVDSLWMNGMPMAEGSSVQRPRQEQTQSSSSTLHHRLSFDPASGVIMLPDDGDWLLDNAMSSEEDETDDYSPDNGGLEQSITESMLLNSELSTEGAGSSSTPLVSTSPTTPSRLSRYRTYFHHPERRKQHIPGAFPER